MVAVYKVQFALLTAMPDFDMLGEDNPSSPLEIYPRSLLQTVWLGRLRNDCYAQAPEQEGGNEIPARRKLQFRLDTPSQTSCADEIPSHSTRMKYHKLRGPVSHVGDRLTRVLPTSDS